MTKKWVSVGYLVHPVKIFLNPRAFRGCAQARYVVVVEAQAPKVYPRMALAIASTLSGSVVMTLRGGKGLPSIFLSSCIETWAPP